MIRLADEAVIRAFGLLFSAGKQIDEVKEEYERLTGNFARVGRVAHHASHLGRLGRFLVRAGVRVGADTLVRQRLFGVDRKDDVIAAAAGYFSIVDFFDFDMEVTEVTSERVTFKFCCCPVGYRQGEKLMVAQRQLDETGSAMRVVQLVRLPDGTTPVNVSVYRKQTCRSS